MNNSCTLAENRKNSDRECPTSLRWWCSRGTNQCCRNERYRRLDMFSDIGHCTVRTLHFSLFYCWGTCAHMHHYLSTNAQGNFVHMWHRMHICHLDLAPTNNWWDCTFALVDILACIHRHRRNYDKPNSPAVWVQCIRRRRINDNIHGASIRSTGLEHIAVSNWFYWISGSYADLRPSNQPRMLDHILDTRVLVP